MPCSDSSSSIAMRLDDDERFIAFDFAKITCGREITAKTGYSDYCKGRSLNNILAIPYAQVAEDLKLAEEEERFVLYLEWDALRSTIAQYLGVDVEDIDRERCQITSVESTENGETEIALVILPPKELTKILPCSLGDN
jgi:hypothetical protein